MNKTNNTVVRNLLNLSRSQRFCRVYRQIASRLLERLAYINIKPHRILLISHHVDLLLPMLKQQYQQSQKIVIADSLAVLHHIHNPWYRRRKYNKICSQFNKLAIGDSKIDLIIADMTLPWLADHKDAIHEYWRILSPGGLLLLSTVGPDTLTELRSAFAQIDNYSHINEFIDMHDLGDALLRCGYENPVVDMETSLVRYRCLSDLFTDLKNTSSIHSAQRRLGLLGRHAWQQLLTSYPRESATQDSYSATLEVVYGLGWKPQVISQSIQNEQGEVTIPISHIQRQR